MSKYDASNEFWECFIAKDGDINCFGRIALFPLMIIGYCMWLTLDFLFVKND